MQGVLTAPYLDLTKLYERCCSSAKASHVLRQAQDPCRPSVSTSAFQAPETAPMLANGPQELRLLQQMLPRSRCMLVVTLLASTSPSFVHLLVLQLSPSIASAVTGTGAAAHQAALTQSQVSETTSVQPEMLKHLCLSRQMLPVFRCALACMHRCAGSSCMMRWLLPSASLSSHLLREASVPQARSGSAGAVSGT